MNLKIPNTEHVEHQQHRTFQIFPQIVWYVKLRSLTSSKSRWVEPLELLVRKFYVVNYSLIYLLKDKCTWLVVIQYVTNNRISPNSSLSNFTLFLSSPLCLSLSPNFFATYARPPIYYFFRLFFPWIFSSRRQFEAAALIFTVKCGYNTFIRIV